MSSVLRHTDRYQLTMLAAYAQSGLAGRRAVFELFVRSLPPSRRYLVACGVARAVEALRALSCDDAQVEAFAKDPYLGPAFADARVATLFSGLRFRGRVWAIPEGRICFPGEPLLRVEGTLAEAQLVETLLLSIVNHDVRIASKCARIVHAAAGRPCYEFGTRRTHESAAVDAARAAYVAGFAGTSNEEAHARHGVPVAGTMAHSFVLAHAADEGEEGELRAFANLAATFPARPTFLVDTFDTHRGVERAIAVSGAALGGVRIDSGDLGAEAIDARRLLDQHGVTAAGVFVSDDLDEYRIESLVTSGAPVSSFGVGTMAVATPDAPSLGAVYKLVAIEDRDGNLVAVQKRASKKGSSAAPKQVWRRDDAFEDVVMLDGEAGVGKPLLELVLDDLVVLGDLGLGAARARLVADRGRLPPELSSLVPRTDGEHAPVTVSPRLGEVMEHVARNGRAVLLRPHRRASRSSVAAKRGRESQPARWARMESGSSPARPPNCISYEASSSKITVRVLPGIRGGAENHRSTCCPFASSTRSPSVDVSSEVTSRSPCPTARVGSSVLGVSGVVPSASATRSISQNVGVNVSSTETAAPSPGVIVIGSAKSRCTAGPMGSITCGGPPSTRTVSTSPSLRSSVRILSA